MSELSPAELTAANKVMDEFLAAFVKRDESALKSLLTAKCAADFSMSAPPGTLEFRREEARVEDGEVVVPVHFNVVEDPSQNPPCALQHVLVRENGGWRVDMNKTMEKTFGFSPDAMMDAMVEGMKQVGEAMGEAMSGLGEAMGEAMGSAFEQPDDVEMLDEIPSDEEAIASGEYDPFAVDESLVPDDWAAYAISSGREYAGQVSDWLKSLGVNTEFDIDYDGFYQKRFVNWLGMIEHHISQHGIYACGSGIGDLVQEDAQAGEHVRASLRSIRFIRAESPESIGLTAVGNTLEHRFIPDMESGGWLEEADFRARLRDVLMELTPAE